MVRSGAFDAAFLMRPTRVEQVRELAAAGENMPPKSTFFFPKLLSGTALQPAPMRNGTDIPSANGIGSQRHRGVDMTDVQGHSRMRATVRRDGQAFSHAVEIREHQLTVDEPASVGGATTARIPQGLLAASLASCAAITMEMYAQRKGWDLGPVEVSVEYTPPERGCVTKFELVLRLPDDLAPDRAERLRVIASQCPVHRALEGDVMFQERIERVHLAA